ncbi:MAG: fibronectin type III domain-containing protein, partial [Kiritimatiellae bacterium]|nr:fibronectin type III domain-containing protein [Kiritimatiellia bacterium]
MRRKKISRCLLASLATFCITLVQVRTAAAAAAAAPTFSKSRGFYDSAISVTISTATSGATIRYTTDGRAPSASVGTVYGGSLTIPATTPLRAVALAGGMTPSPVTTHTYIFLDKVLTQSRPAGYPTQFYTRHGLKAADYAMDPAVYNDSRYSGMIKNAFKSIPTLAITMPAADLFGNGAKDSGVYFSGGTGGTPEPEKDCAAEWIRAGGGSTQVDGKLRSHSHRQMKGALRLLFKAPAKLNYALFADAPLGSSSAKSTFGKLMLRSGNNDCFAGNPTTEGPQYTTYIKDEWARQTQIAITGAGNHGHFCHLYLNGLYWGLYNVCERTDARWAADNFGGAKTDWYANMGEGDITGNTARWNYFRSGLTAKNMGTAANYTEFKNYLDVQDFCDYILVCWYCGGADWPGHNFYATARTSPAAPIRFWVWDAEASWGTSAGRANTGAWVSPGFLSTTPDSNTATQYAIARAFRAAWKSPDFRILFADRLYEHGYNGGLLTDSKSKARWDTLVSYVEDAVVCDTARWGDSLHDAYDTSHPLYTPHGHWTPEINRVRNLMTGNADQLRNACRAASIFGFPVYPSLDPPAFAQRGGTVAAGFKLTISKAQSGTIFYRTDGGDPRDSGGGVASAADGYDAPVTLSATCTVKARLKNGSTWSALEYAAFTVTGSVPQPPAAPGNLSATAQSSSQIKLTWQDNSGNESSFRIDRSTNGSTWNQLAAPGANVTAYTDSGLAAATKYYYRVRAENSAGDSAYSSVATATTDGNAPPAPSNFSAAAASSTRIDLAWTDNSSNEENFKIKWGTSNASLLNDISVAANATSYSHTGLTPDTTYYYQIKAEHATLGDSAYTPVASARTSLSLPAAPSALTASAQSPASISIAWTDNSGNETGFKVDRRQSGTDPWVRIATPGANATRFTDTGLVESTQYYYKVKATNGAGDSGYSNIAADTTPAAPQPPDAPSGLAAVATSSTRIDLAWTDNSSNEENFKIKWGTSSASLLNDIIVAANATSYSHTGLAPNTTYSYQIKAEHATLGDSAYTPVVSATTPAGSNGTGAFLEQDGLVVMEVESIPASEAWVLETESTGYSGAGYYRWDGPDYFSDSTHGVLLYTFKISSAGTYHFRWHNRHDNPTDPTEWNDTWVSMDDGVPVKCFQGNNNVWNWVCAFEPSFGVFEYDPRFTLAAGYHTLRIAGRSYGHKIDRIHLYKDSVSNPTSFAHPESAREGDPIDQPPAAPSGLSAAPVSSTRIDLKWTDNSSNEENFKIRWCTDGVSFDDNTLVAAANATSIAHTGLTPNTTYYYKIKAEHAALGDSAYTAVVSATTPVDAQPPAAPSGLSAAPVSSTRIDLSWTDNSSNEEDFKLRWGTTEADQPNAIILAPDSTACSHTGLAPDTTYYYRLQAEHSTLGDSAYTPVVSAKTPADDGALRKWQTKSLDFVGPASSETDASPNPFLDYRLQVRFTAPSGKDYDVPGFFAGNGSGGGSGNVWRALFTPDEPGTWRYRASFRAGANVAVDLAPEAGAAAGFDGASGSFEVEDADPGAPGFLKLGRLEYAGGHYLKFRDGGYWLKTGADSPENFLAYDGFDNTVAGPFDLHTYAAHEAHWNSGDPDWGGGKGKGIIGALNYLASQHVNSVYFLPMNIGGDGQDTWPFVGPIVAAGSTANDNLHYDISKLAQWEIVFAHAQRQGIVLHVVLNEAEGPNKKELDNGELGVERKLFYREMVARFGHHNALQWNLCEEYNVGWDLGADRIRNFAQQLVNVDPYDHPVTVHHAGALADIWAEFLGDPRFSLTSFQTGNPDTIDEWRALTRDAGRPLPICLDEYTVNNEFDPIWAPLNDPIALRKEKFWAIYLSGGMQELILATMQEVNDFTVFQDSWRYMGYARKFLEENTPYWDMEPCDSLLGGEAVYTGRMGVCSGQVFAAIGQVYAVYLPTASTTGSLDLRDAPGRFLKRWFNPRTGAFEGTATTVSGGAWLALGAPPSSSSEDWVVLLQTTAAPAAPTALAAEPAGTTRVRLTWRDSSATEENFKVKRGTDGVNFPDETIVAANQTCLVDEGLTPGATYYYIVKAEHATYGDSPYSPAVAATTLGAEPSVAAFQDGLLPSAGYAGTRDTQLDSENPAVNHGTAASIGVDGSPDLGALLKWDLAAIPVDSRVLAATVTLEVLNNSPDTYELYAVKRNWSETQASWTQYAAGSAWQQAGAQGANDRGSAALGAVPAVSMGPACIPLNGDGLALVQAWVTDPAANNGLTIQGYTQGDGTAFAAREAALAFVRPKLTVRYVAGDTPAVATPQISPAGATFDSSVAVTLSCATAGATIFYRTDQTDPTDLSYHGLGTSPRVVTLTESATLKARAYKAGMAASAVASASFVKTGDTNPPAAPTDLAAVPVAGTRIDLSWTDTSSNEEDFKLRWGTTAADQPNAVILAPDTTAYSHTGLTPNTTYYYRLQAEHSTLGDSAYTPLLSATTPAGTTPGTIEVRIAAGPDDIEQPQDGTMDLASSDLELTEDGAKTQLVGLRFTGVDIPAGASITAAYVQFETDETGSAGTSLKIGGEAAADARPFTAAAYDAGARPRTAASVAWSPPAWNSVGEAGAAQRTPDLSAVIQETVDQPGWQTGNALALFISGSGKRVACAFEGKPAGAALLHVEFNSMPGDADADGVADTWEQAQFGST